MTKGLIYAKSDVQVRVHRMFEIYNHKRNQFVRMNETVSTFVSPAQCFGMHNFMRAPFDVAFGEDSEWVDAQGNAQFRVFIRNV